MLGVFTVDGLLDSSKLFEPARRVSVASALGIDTTAPAGGAVLMIHDHESHGASRVPDVLAQFTFPLVGQGNALVAMGNLGVTMVVVETEAPYSVQVEEDLTTGLSAVVASIAKGAARDPDSGFTPTRADYLLPGGRILWWHRILVMRMEDFTPTEFVDQFAFGSDIRGSVGDGFTQLAFGPGADDPQRVAAAIEQAWRGLLAATEDWMVADTTNRQLTEYLDHVRIDETRREHQYMRATASLGRRMVRDAQMLKLYRDERDRYLVVHRRNIWRAAQSAWGLVGELATLDSRVASVQQQAELTARDLQERKDSFRNGVLFVIASLTAFQSCLLLVDFSVADDLLITQPMRVALTVVVLSLTAVLLGQLLRDRAQARRIPTD